MAAPVAPPTIAPIAAPRPPPIAPPKIAPAAPPRIAPPTGSCAAASCTGAAMAIGHLEKFLSPSRHESDSVTARGHGRMERAGHGVRRQLSAEKTCGVSARPREAFDPAGSNGVRDQREYDARLDALGDAADVIRRPAIEIDE